MPDYHPEERWTAVLLAGQRPEGDPLAEHCGQDFKALIHVGGVSMLRRVTDTLLAVPQIDRIVILAQQPEALMVGDAASLRDNPRIRLSQSSSAIASSIAAIAGTSVAPWPVLVVTADHVLLTPEIVASFFSEIGNEDLAIGVGERKAVEAGFPATRRTWLKFRGGHYSGANLFALRSAKVLPGFELWSSVEQDRKRALKLVGKFGPWLLLRTLTRTIGFAEAFERAGRRLGCTARPIVLPQPEAVIDVDNPADLALAESILAQRTANHATLAA